MTTIQHANGSQAERHDVRPGIPRASLGPLLGAGF
jgi:hypothetical protein